jgi:hypothetical protein|nr:hypothetical protein [Bradyrhizobium sp.]
MVDDRPEDTGPSAESVRPKRAGPTIDLEATEVSGDTANADAGVEPEPAPRQPSASPMFPVMTAAVAGAAAAALVLGVAWFLGWNAAWPLAAPPTDAAAIDGLAARLASVESKTNAPPPAPMPDAAAAARVEQLEKSSASLRTELAAARARSEELAAVVNDIKSAPRESSPPPDLSAIDERLSQLERTTHAQGSEIAQDKQEKQNAKPADDMLLRRVVAASLLDISVRQGDPYVAALAAAKSLTGDADALKPLDEFAASGLPTPAVLCRELLTLVPKLSPPAPENSAADQGSIVDRLQAGASRLVRIERTDAVGNDRGAVVARVTAAALRNDAAEARRELNTLPSADRAAAQSWIDKVDARDAALAASRQFAADAITALAKPAP